MPRLNVMKMDVCTLNRKWMKQTKIMTKMIPNKLIKAAYTRREVCISKHTFYNVTLSYNK